MCMLHKSVIGSGPDSYQDEGKTLLYNFKTQHFDLTLIFIL